jgi:cyanophycinase-like exopeptidase
VLRRFIELAGREAARIVVLTAASTRHEEMWDIHDAAFADLGVKQRTTENIASRGDAGDEAQAPLYVSTDVPG